MKENLASGSQAADSAVKSKSPMTPKENILHQVPLAFGSRASAAKKQTLLHRLGPSDTVAAPGRVTKTRKDKPSAGATQPPKLVISKVKVEKSETTKVLKQGPKRLRISGGAAVKQEVQLENTFQVLATKPDTLWDNQAATTSTARPCSALSKKQTPTKTKAMHLSPIRKGALTRKKSFEWEKKKSKMLIKNKKQLTISSEESLENAPLPDAF